MRYIIKRYKIVLSRVYEQFAILTRWVMLVVRVTAASFPRPLGVPRWAAAAHVLCCTTARRPHVARIFSTALTVDDHSAKARVSNKKDRLFRKHSELVWKADTLFVRKALHCLRFINVRDEFSDTWRNIILLFTRRVSLGHRFDEPFSVCLNLFYDSKGKRTKIILVLYLPHFFSNVKAIATTSLLWHAQVS